jgi:hypothetical protein
MFPGVIKRSSGMQDRFLSKVENLRHVQRQLSGAFDACFDFLGNIIEFKNITEHLTYLELIHDGYDLFLQGFVSDLATS